MRTGPETMEHAVQAEADRLVETLRTTRLTVLTGAAGSGKTQLLREGVLPRLRRRSDDGEAPGPMLRPTPGERRRGTVRPRELVVWCDRWDGSPAEQVHACLDALTDAPLPDPAVPRPPLALRAKALSAERGARLLFVFDQGDRIAAAPAGDTGPATEYDAIVNALCSVSPSVHLLLSARDGALPPSVQSRLGSPDTRVVRLADPGAEGEAPESRPADAVPPLRRDDVYTSIAERLGAIAGRPHAPAWGGVPAPPAVLADHPATGFLPPADAPAAPPAFQREPLVAGAPAGGASGRAGGGSGAGEIAGRSPPPPFVSGSFAGVSARRARISRRAWGVASGLGLALAAGVGAVLWQDRGDPVWPPQPSDRRAANGKEASLPVPGSPAAASAPAVAGDQGPAPLPSTTATSAGTVAEDAAGAPGTEPAAPEALPNPAPAAGRDAEALLADDLLREMSRHGVAGPAVGATDDPVEVLAVGRRVAVVPYAALRAIATARSPARNARIVAPLFTEEMHVIVAAASPLAFIHQIAGRRIDVGPARSARRQTAVAFLQRLFDRPLAARETVSADLDTALAGLLGGRVDAIVLPEPQPSAWLSRLPTAQRARLRLLDAAPGDPSTGRALRSYLPATVQAPAATSGSAVRTFAVMNFLVASPATTAGRDDTATVAAKALCRALPVLRHDGHPKWREVDPALALPTPLPYDRAALAVMRACDALPRAGNDIPTTRRP